MNEYVISFQEIDRSMSMIAGGKGANLGELSGIEGIQVPEGFCITTEAYKKITANNQDLNRLLDELTLLKVEDRKGISKICSEIRLVIERLPIAENIGEEITEYLTKFSENDAFAVRSSATAEDLPTASFAGQQDTYLNIIGKEAILQHISKCWASLFADRAVIYRMQNGFDHSVVYLSVIVQKMIFPHASGILFTADPVTSNRKLLSIDAGFGLGEALVAGLVAADNYKVREEEIVDKMMATKKLTIRRLKEGGTEIHQIDPGQQKIQTLTDLQILQLARIGRKIEKHFGSPQDIEWCLADDTFYIVQSPLLKEAEKLVQANIIHEKEDIYYLSFEELHELVRTNKPDYQLIKKRKDEFKLYEKLTPPRVITSDGEIIAGKYNRGNLPAEAIVGLAVSSGVAEGRARVILKMEDADLEEGDILVTAFTDPSWTPLFVSIKGLVTEVGGLMTHGAVIAREYGLPAIVGIENATNLIKDGQRIRVHGTEGYVEIL